MQYDRFDDLITQKHGVIVKNWPLKRFCNPSAVASCIELDILKLSRDEMRAWESERFSSRVAMMMSSPPSPSTPVAPSPTTSSAATAPDLITPVPSASVPPEPASPTPPEMVLISEITKQDASQPASNDVGQGVTQSTTQPPAPSSELVAEIIRQDPTLQSIDPALIVAGLAQGHHHSVAVCPLANANRPPHPTPLISQNKRNRDAFEIVTPVSFHAHATKKLRKEQKGRRAKKNTPAGENISPVEGAR